MFDNHFWRYTMKRIIKTVIIVFSVVLLTTNGIVFATAAAPNDYLFNSQWGHRNTGQNIFLLNKSGTQGIDANILNAWDITKGSSSVIVGILDTGIDISHEDLSGVIYTNPGEIPGNGVDDDHNGYIDDVNGWDFANDDNTVFDNVADDAHGTGLAAVIAAVSNNGKGISGVAPNVKILPLKFRNGLSVNSDRVKDAIEAIAYAKAMGVSIINCSFTCPNTPELKEAIEKSGILFVCAPGNGSTNLDVSPVYPCCYDLPNVLGVASINCTGELSDFSSYGMCVPLAAPGENIMTAVPGNKYSFFSGTSLSVPYAAGAAALIKSYRPNLGANEIAEVLKASAKPLDSLLGKVETGGMLDAYKALNFSEKDIAKNSGIEIVLSGTMGRDDWYRSNVTVTMKPANSTTSNILYSLDRTTWQKYTAPVILSTEGKTKLYYCIADESGTKGKVEVKEIKIDCSKPTFEINSPKNGDTFLFGSKITVEYFVNDELSGVNLKNTKPYSSNTIAASKAGANILKLDAQDNAGNPAALNIKYNVLYNYSGALEPKEGQTVKCGSPILVKFSLTNADGAVVGTAKAKLFTSPVNNGAAAKETAAKSAVSTNSTNSFTFDNTLKQYTYSLSTKGFTPGRWRLRIELDDGTSKYVNVVLK